MNQFTPTDPHSLLFKPFYDISKGWWTINVDGPTPNAMTASWAGLGIMWNKPVLLLYVRPERHTHTLLSHTSQVTVCCFDASECRKELGYLGRVSGRDEDKISGCGLTWRREGGACFFDECRWYVKGRVLHSQLISEEGFNPEVAQEIMSMYGGAKGSLHRLYTLEICNLMTR